AELAHQRHILGPAMIMVASDVTGIVAQNPPRQTGEGVPDRRPAAVLPHCALDLIGRRRGAPQETVGKARRHRTASPIAASAEEMIARNGGDQVLRGFRRMSGVKIIRQKRRGPVASVQIGLPKEAGGDRAPRPPRLAERAQFRLAWARSKTEPVGYRELQINIRCGPDIRPTQREY